MRGLRVLFALVCLAGCASAHPDAVPSCPHCRDPLTKTLPDGRSYVMTRLRLDGLPEDPSLLFFGASVQPGVPATAR